MTEKITIGLICGGTSGEHEISLISAYNIQAALDREKYNVLLIGIDKNGGWYLGNNQSFWKNVKDVRKISFVTEFPVRLPQRNLTEAGESGAVLSEVDVFSQSHTVSLVKMVRCRDCLSFLGNLMLGQMFTDPQSAWTRTLQSVCSESMGSR